MTQAKLFRYVLYGALLALAVPALVALSNSDGENSTFHRIANYLNISQEVDHHDNEDETTQDNVDGNKITVDNPSNSSESNDSESSKSDNSENKTSEAVAKESATYVVKAGDTYGCIAESYYGSYEQYPLVMAANGAGKYRGFSERHLDVGAKLTLPAITASQVKPATSLCN